MTAQTSVRGEGVSGVTRSLVANAVVVIPTYNEAENIIPLVEAICAIAPKLDVLFVDDNSQDGTHDRIRECQAKYPGKIHLLSRPGKLGLGTAYIAGFSWVLERHYTIAISMDADLSHNPVYLPPLLALLEQWDAVFGSRYIPGGGTRNWGLIRRIVSRCGSLYGRTLLGMTVHDLTGGFNAWHRRVLERVDLQTIVSEGYAFQIELKYRAQLAGCSLKEMPIVFVDRRVGQSKMTTGIVLEAIWRVLGLRRLSKVATVSVKCAREGL
jgi:dolichol-phosphate mannosyltransferase